MTWQHAQPDLPLGWVWTTLGEVADAELGKMLDRKKQTGQHPMKYLRNINVRWHSVDLDDLLTIDVTPDTRDRYSVRAGDLLACEGGEPGRCAVVPAAADGLAFQKALHRIRPADGIQVHYLAYALDAMAALGYLAEHLTGSTIKHLPRERLVNLPLPLPPSTEQIRIVARLDTTLGALESALEDLNTLERRLSVARRAIVQRVCLGSVGPFGEETEVTETAASAVDAAPGELPDLPAGWHWTTLGELADVVGGVTKDAKKQDNATYVEVPYLRVANVQEAALKLDSVTTIRVPPAKAESLRLLPGDVLMNEGGDRDKLGRGWVWEGQIPECIHQNHVFRARIRGDALHPKLLSWHGNTFGRTWFEANGKQTTNLASISLTNVKRLPVPVPPADEQPQMVDFVERHLEMLDVAALGIASLRGRCAALRRSILASAFAGRLDRQEESDAAADVLLKEIAEVRTATARDKKKRTVRKARNGRAPKPEETPT